MQGQWGAWGVQGAGGVSATRSPREVMPLTEQFSLSGECVVNGDAVNLAGGMDSQCVPRGVLGPLQRASAMLGGSP